MNPNDPKPPPLGALGDIDPGELLARALNTAQPSDGAARWTPPTPEVLAALLPQYHIESLLGHGGMGAVYKGRQAALDRPVAIKLLPAELAADPQFIARFQREARTLARLQHPGIVAVHDFGQTSEGHLYFVMEYVDGTDLHRILHGPGLNPAQALELICQVCDALHYAHSKEVIHRDIKPGNILVTTEGRAKLADFGLARPLTEGDSAMLTGANVIMGTEAYMAPEQREGHAFPPSRGGMCPRSEPDAVRAGATLACGGRAEARSTSRSGDTPRLSGRVRGACAAKAVAPQARGTRGGALRAHGNIQCAVAPSRKGRRVSAPFAASLRQDFRDDARCCRTQLGGSLCSGCAARIQLHRSGSVLSSQCAASAVH